MASDLGCTLKRNNGTDLDVLYPTTKWEKIIDHPTTFTPTAHAHGGLSDGGSVTADILPGTNNAFDLGNTSYRFAQIWATAFYEGGTQLAQRYAPYYLTRNAVTGSRSLASTDANDILTVNVTATLTIPSGMTVGTQIAILRTHASYVTTITAAAGVYLNGTYAGSITIDAQWKMITLTCYATNYWVASGL
jgi:hypothetical protein